MATKRKSTKKAKDQAFTFGDERERTAFLALRNNPDYSHLSEQEMLRLAKDRDCQRAIRAEARKDMNVTAEERELERYHEYKQEPRYSGCTESELRSQAKEAREWEEFSMRFN